jgi:hypothetical protein
MNGGWNYSVALMMVMINIFRQRKGGHAPSFSVVQLSDAAAPRFLEGEDALQAIMRAWSILAEETHPPSSVHPHGVNDGTFAQDQLELPKCSTCCWLDTMPKIATMALSRSDSSMPC